LPDRINISKWKANELRGDTKLMNLIRDAISGTESEEGWQSFPKWARISPIMPLSTQEILVTRALVILSKQLAYLR